MQKNENFFRDIKHNNDVLIHYSGIKMYRKFIQTVIIVSEFISRERVKSIELE